MFRLVQSHYSYMKFILNNFFIFLLCLSSSVYADSFYKKFTIKVSGIKIGELVWVVQIDDNIYSNYIKLNSKGFLSAIYKFEGDYISKGIIENNKLKTQSYSHVWKTTKVEKNMRLDFKNNFLSSINQIPHEKENLRVDVFSIKGSKDPLSSFLEIIIGGTSSVVIDGRRKYKMNSNFNKKENRTVISISDYFNLWTGHKKTKFELISFEKKEGNLLPVKINIHFDGRIFRLQEN